MACAALKRQNPFEDTDSPFSSSSPAKRACSYSAMNIESSPSSSSPRTAAPNPLPGHFPLLSDSHFVEKIARELRKTQATKKPLKSEHHTTDSLSASVLRDRGNAGNEDSTFSVAQVRMLCDRLLREREVEIRAEYNRILNGKLAEQYETFVKFAQDQIHRQNHPSDDLPYYS